MDVEKVTEGSKEGIGHDERGLTVEPSNDFRDPLNWNLWVKVSASLGAMRNEHCGREQPH